MNQILSQGDNNDIDIIDEYEEEVTYRHTHRVKFSILMVLMVTVLSICSLKLISLATNNEENTKELKEEIIQENQTTNSEQENKVNDEIQNNIDMSKSETLKEKNENEIHAKDDPKALEQINTKTRKTSSGKTYTSIGLLNIPSLNIKYQILSKTSDELLKISVNKYWGSNPNEVGNMCILGHNYKDSRFFGKLPKIKKGAKVYITDLQGKTVSYKVYNTDVIEEDDVSCTTQETDGKTEITLITCYYEPGYKHATKRFIVKARAE